MDNFLIISSGLLVAAGLLGCMVPQLPAIVLSYLGMVVIHLSSIAEYSVHFFIQWGIIVIAVHGLGYFLPQWGSKKFCSSKICVWSGLIGVMLGMYFGKWGIVAGAVAGPLLALVFTLNENQRTRGLAFYDFIIYLAGTSTKLVVAGIMLRHYINDLT
ncbi:MAG TPA: DUF456 family protein [Paludibacter sp.]|nr:DUF456 family protein [Paludibacter sp.]